MSNLESKEIVTMIFKDNHQLKVVGVDKNRIEKFSKHMHTIYQNVEHITTIDGDIRKAVLGQFIGRETVHYELKLTGWLSVSEKEFSDAFALFPRIDDNH